MSISRVFWKSWDGLDSIHDIRTHSKWCIHKGTNGFVVRNVAHPCNFFCGGGWLCWCQFDGVIHGKWYQFDIVETIFLEWWLIYEHWDRCMVYCSWFWETSIPKIHWISPKLVILMCLLIWALNPIIKLCDVPIIVQSSMLFLSFGKTLLDPPHIWKILAQSWFFY